MKKCNKCNIVQELTVFGKNGKYIDAVCKSCRKLKYLENREENIKKSLENRSNNSEYYKNLRKKRYEKNKEKFLQQSKEYYQANKQASRDYHKKWHHKTKVLDSMYKLKRNLRYMNKRYIKEQKSQKTLEILGCTYKDFKIYIELKFQNWMNWSNYGSINSKPPTGLNQCWDIDHIIPLSTAKNEEELYKLNHYTNLQPMCSYTNRWIKRNTYG